MSEYFKKIFSKPKEEIDEDDEEAYKEQQRVFNQAQEILKKQQLEQDQHK